MMLKSLKRYSFLILAISGFCIIPYSQAKAAYYTIEDSTFSEISGNFTVRSDYAGGTGQQRNEVLTHRGGTVSNTISVSSLWDFLDGQGVTSTAALVFSFDLNETGQNNFVQIDDLQMNIGTQSFLLGNNTVRVNDWTLGQGNNNPEAFFRIDLGYDFMKQFNASSTENLYIMSTISQFSAGPERFYLDASLTGQSGAPVPEPATVLLLGFGLTGLMCFRRKLRKK
ncbi:MAG TPA: PEP-CTERM sorting domain-containing protein [Desulfobacteraceae bacterium]|nr:PEP-CTERM sorting domain-containing protein [Desulfobacteraceae bacterium]